MNPSNAIVNRFVDFSDYLSSSEFKTNPKANVFTPLRKVTSEPAEGNYLPFPLELKSEIALHLNLKDFATFSSINVDNYLSLRSDDLLVERVIKNEVEVRIFEKLKDLKQKAQQYSFDNSAGIETDENHNAVIPPLAISPGPSQLIFKSNLNSYNPESFFLVKLFQDLCMLARDDSTDVFFRAYICSLAIDINNKMSKKNSEHAALIALNFLCIASQVNQLINIEDKSRKVYRLAQMIENKEFHRGKLNKASVFKEVLDLSNKNQLDWDKFIDGLRVNPIITEENNHTDDSESDDELVDDDDLLDD